MWYIYPIKSCVTISSTLTEQTAILLYFKQYQLLKYQHFNKRTKDFFKKIGLIFVSWNWPPPPTVISHTLFRDIISSLFNSWFWFCFSVEVYIYMCLCLYTYIAFLTVGAYVFMCVYISIHTCVDTCVFHSIWVEIWCYQI